MFNIPPGGDDVEKVRSQDLSADMIARETAPKKTWFFEIMGNGRIIATEEREAWQICYNKSTWKRRDFRLLGTSNGQTYKRIVSESNSKSAELRPRIDQKKKDLQKYQDIEERLIMDEVVDMEGDPSDTKNEENKQKVLRIRTIMDRIHDELDKLETEYYTVTRGVNETAFNAELEVAKKNQQERIDRGEELDWPDENLNIVTPEGSHKPRRKILGLLNGG